jgi:alkylation response protein AidB-like acyl-CoA dehydrogenase
VRFTPQDEEFREQVRGWLAANLTGPFAQLRSGGGPGREHEQHAGRLAWNRHLASAGWTCLGWPAEHGGRGATLAQQVIFHEEYARAGAPEFNEVFFDGARTSAANVVGEPGDGWRIAKVTLAFERGVAMLGRLVGFRRELDDLIALARRTGPVTDPVLRDKLARAWTHLAVMRAYALDHAADNAAAEASVLKVLWSRWHQELGELAMQVLGASGLVTRGEPDDLNDWQRLFLFGKAETIYGGSDEIQLDIIASRALGLPRGEHA